MSEIRAEKSIEINASAQKVWEIMEQVDRWPELIPVIKSAMNFLGEPFSTGSRFKFKPAMGMLSLSFKVTVIESTPPRRVAWEGGGPGVTAVHVFELEEKQGKTVLKSSETFTGPGVIFLRMVLRQKDLDNLHEKWIEALKKAAEA